MKSYKLIISLFLLMLAQGTMAGEGKTLIISAEGLADPEAETYKRDKGLMIEDLRKDARRQVIEKAVGTFVESSTLVENYELIDEKVMTKSTGLIKQVIKQSEPWIGDDGFAHMLLKAEVYIGDIRDTLENISKTSRVNLIKQHGNPRISVNVVASDAARGSVETRSDIAENILKEHIKAYGYRVWSEGNNGKRTSDFKIGGKAKFQRIDLKLKASGLRVSKYQLTSWSVKCTDTSTGEELYFNNQVPKHKAWASEDEALKDIGKLIGGEFSRDFFEQHLIQPSQIFQLEIAGLPDYDSSKLLKKEMIGLRSILNVDLRNFDADGTSLMEVEFSGSTSNFSDLINASVIKPLNAKAGSSVFKLQSVAGNLVQINYQGKLSGEELVKQFSSLPPASLVNAPKARIAQIAKSDASLKKVEAMQQGVSTMGGSQLLDSVSDF